VVNHVREGVEKQCSIRETAYKLSARRIMVKCQ
jgi:hypothetical protein